MPSSDPDAGASDFDLDGDYAKLKSWGSVVSMNRQKKQGRSGKLVIDQELLDLWESSPDVSDVFGGVGTYSGSGSADADEVIGQVVFRVKGPSRVAFVVKAEG